MATATAIARAIINFRDLETKLGLVKSTNPNFFPEWQSETAQLSDREIEALSRLSQRYLLYLEESEVSEGTLNIILLSPLLDALGLCDPPYRIRGETWVEIQTEVDSEEGKVSLEGRIDALTIRDNFWLVVIEGKRSGFSVLRAVPQALAYMSACPDRNLPIFGLVTNGYDYLFVKLIGNEFALSHNFTLLSDSDRNLIRVAQILKHLVQYIPVAKDFKTPKPSDQIN
ncbi:type I restriction endonuclease subunit R [Thermosynechococcus sp. PP45]|uniref:type I restriction endonuclease subunit R n=1 Tax=unclassified Thermosynechococcus TaxID=2622553 RepID=UPI002673FCB8|nr:MULTISPECIES: type I restriction endonuclease subunit R [unclassified Thermosynechococcus]WKT81783.1 type I restriction endonuclease subunit R [Thermosynechococcus sp. PP45]WNC25395.1 type I restriction endonuclease subunit R [Thermosynechococcus sp. PP551]WNC27973.1 type I restriction endonuclease subunit R [Thermosynechococcus sp. PP555]